MMQNFQTQKFPKIQKLNMSNYLNFFTVNKCTRINRKT